MPTCDYWKSDDDILALAKASVSASQPSLPPEPVPSAKPMISITGLGQGGSSGSGPTPREQELQKKIERLEHQLQDSRSQQISDARDAKEWEEIAGRWYEKYIQLTDQIQHPPKRMCLRADRDRTELMGWIDRKPYAMTTSFHYRFHPVG